MFQKLWSGFTTATLVVSALSIAAPSHANQPGEPDERNTANVSHAEAQPEAVASTANSPDSAAESANPNFSVASPADVATVNGLPASEATKVGEYQTQESSRPAIANIHAHTLNGRQAVTLYVRGIPVLTFLGSRAAESNATPPREVQIASASANALASDEKLPTPPAGAAASQQQVSNRASNSTDPAWRAAAIAARINQFQQNNGDAAGIVARWENSRQRYVIRLGQQELVELNSSTVLPENTEAGAEEVLQATNRLRRLLGNAPALTAVANRPRLTTQQVTIRRIRARLQGLASWYGPGFHGAMSASGETFNQHALTAAHRTLPFGTQVRVTNIQTGRSVIVRINDRGPFGGGRIIDLSAAAASAIGLKSAGVGPVTLEVLQTAYQR